MNITVRPRPEVLAEFTHLCVALDEHTAAQAKEIDDLVDAGLVERVPGTPGCRLTVAGETLRAAREE